VTIVSHQHKLIFLKPRKTAGTSVENALLKIIGHQDWVATSTENEPLATHWLATPNVTRSTIPGEKPIKRLLKRLGPAPFKLREHMVAKDVAALVGHDVWSRYTKVSIVRDPWQRLVSLWRWRTRRDNLQVSFEDFLSAIESRSRQREKSAGARRWSNVPFYSIDGQMVLDRVVRFESLADDFSALIDDLDLPDPGPLPRLKVSRADQGKAALSLTDEQAIRIAKLCVKEIAWFRYGKP